MLLIKHPILFFKRKVSLDISCESSAWQIIHMKCQDKFFSEKTYFKKLSAADDEICLDFKR